MMRKILLVALLAVMLISLSSVCMAGTMTECQGLSLFENNSQTFDGSSFVNSSANFWDEEVVIMGCCWKLVNGQWVCRPEYC